MSAAETSTVRRSWESRLFLTVKDVAAALHVDPRTARRAIEAGQIPAVQIGAQYRIPTNRFLAEVLGEPPESTEPAPATGAGSDNVHPIAPAMTGGGLQDDTRPAG